MSIKFKLTLCLLAVVLFLCVAMDLVNTRVVLPSFQELELQEAGKDLDRVVQSIEREIEHLDLLAQDWGIWDEAYEFVLGENDDFPAANIYNGIFDQIDVTVIAVYDLEGRPLLDYRSEPHDLDSTELLAIPCDYLPADSPLRRSVETPTSVKGLYSTEWGPMLVSAQPVMRNGHVGPVLGTLVMARPLDGTHVNRLRGETHVDFQLASLIGSFGQDAAEGGRSSGIVHGARRFEMQDEYDLTARVALSDLRGRPLLDVVAHVPRAITSRGRSALLSAWVAALAAGLVLLVALYAMLDLGVARPLTRFTRLALTLRGRRQLAEHFDLTRRDEIGLLAQRFEHMLGEIEQSQAALADSSRKAGMSEIATNVLHNVGNMLNGLTVSTSTLHEQVAALPVDDLQALAQRLGQLGPDLSRWVSEDPGGQRLASYVEILAAELGAGRGRAAEEIGRLGKRVGEIAAVVSAQQRIAVGASGLETVDLRSKIEDALRITLPERQGVRVRVARWEEVHARCDPYKLLQILVNLFQNAVEAYVGLERAEPWVEVSLQREGERAVIEVRDEACGIPPELLERIFQHGFTTKRSGHGFGLHSAATGAMEMHGKLVARSPGPCRGATFRLDLPVAEPAAEPERRTAA